MSTQHTQKNTMNSVASTLWDPSRGNSDDTEYNSFLLRLGNRFYHNTSNGTAPLFTTDADNLFDAYLEQFPDGPERQHHRCSACRHFISQFGGLVTIDEQGFTTPAVWNEQDAPERYRRAITELARRVGRAKVTGVFLSSSEAWGQPLTGIWRHMAIRPTRPMIFRKATQTAGQAMAEKREDFKNVAVALGEFTLPMIEQALTLLETESLYRSERVIGPARWLRDVHVARAGAHGSNRANVLWRAVALAPAGFCHPRSSMIGTLLEDIAAGMSFQEVSRRFASKMHPLQYQRPQAAPAAGTVAQAEKIVEQLGAAGSLARRFARVEEIEAIWRPKPQAETPKAAGVFGHLQTREEQPDVPSMRIPATTMTWRKFFEEVLPTADQVEYSVSMRRENFAAITTAVNPDAPPILQWDLPERRNPFSWYVWHNGSPPSQWGLIPGFRRVTAITYRPSMWNVHGEFGHQGHAVMFILDDMRETRQAGAALFPETLKAEFHGIRSVIEAYSRSATLDGMKEGSACGIALQRGGEWDALFRVQSGSRALEYRLDRWD